MTSLAVVIPVYQHFDYAAAAVRSAFAKTHGADVHVFLMDDASPGWGPGVPPVIEALKDFGEKIKVIRYEENGGLTRSWNEGLRRARRLGCDYTCVTNSDVLFTAGWFLAIKEALNAGGNALAGPLTNAPGTEMEQHVRRFVRNYEPDDDEEKLDLLAAQLRRQNGDRFEKQTLNGFCLVAKTSSWWQYPYNRRYVFRPRNDRTASGAPNPTPLMTLNEYELQKRWHAHGCRSALALGSFVFHYRAVSRGNAYRRGQGFRRAP